MQAGLPERAGCCHCGCRSHATHCLHLALGSVQARPPTHALCKTTHPPMLRPTHHSLPHHAPLSTPPATHSHTTRPWPQVLLALPRAACVVPQAVHLRVHTQGGALALSSHHSLPTCARSAHSSPRRADRQEPQTRHWLAQPNAPHPALNAQLLPQPAHAQYFRKKKTLLRHLAKCQLRHPPGDEIYRSPPPPANDPTYVGGAVTSPPIRWGAGLVVCAGSWPLPLYGRSGGPPAHQVRSGRCGPARHAYNFLRLTHVVACSVRAVAASMLGPALRLCCPRLAHPRSHPCAPAVPPAHPAACLRWTARRARCTARTCASCPSCSW